MGYTHYFELKKEPTPAKFKKVVDTLNAIFAEHKDLRKLLAGWDGKGEPEFTSDIIRFNGRGKNSYETFAVLRTKPEWSFCKTQYCPYDVVVCITLLVLKKVLGPSTFSFSSDGCFYGDPKNMEEGWAKAYEIVSYLGIKPPSRDPRR